MLCMILTVATFTNITYYISTFTCWQKHAQQRRLSWRRHWYHLCSTAFPILYEIHRLIKKYRSVLPTGKIQIHSQHLIKLVRLMNGVASEQGSERQATWRREGCHYPPATTTECHLLHDPPGYFHHTGGRGSAGGRGWAKWLPCMMCPRTCTAVHMIGRQVPGSAPLSVLLRPAITNLTWPIICLQSVFISVHACKRLHW